MNIRITDSETAISTMTKLIFVHGVMYLVGEDMHCLINMSQGNYRSK